MADVDEITSEDKEMIEELRSRVSEDLKGIPFYSDDYSLLRWLIGWDYNIDVIVPKLRYAFTTSAALKLNEVDLSSVDIITEHVCSVMDTMAYHPGGIMGFDKQGNVVTVQMLAKGDNKGLLRSGKVSDMLTALIAESEGVLRLIRANEKRFNRKLGVVIICDLDEFSLDLIWMPAVKVYTVILQLLQDLYPDVARKVYVIRAPAAFQVAYNMIYPVLSKQTQSKVDFMGADWKEKLQEVISSDQLFEHWGGTRQASSPFGHLRMGGKVPKKFRYNADNNPEEPPSKEMTSINVPARSEQTVSIKVDLGGSRLKWFFRVSSGDINFSIVHSSGKVVRPMFRLTTEFVPEWGEVTCQLPGEYILTFDNKHGKLWSKEVKYRVKVVAPIKGS
uniref:CRAL-TRIO domain-containing protein n=1 Tax=Plectus sambesii TaxID=2011161 RepID=A0A914VGW0_9BILA